MSKRRTTTATRAPTPIDAATRARKARTQVLIDAAEAALAAYFETITADVAKARARLADAQRWVDGAPMPDSLGAYKRIAQLMFETVNLRRDPQLAAEIERAEEDYAARYYAETELSDVAIAVVLGHASGYSDDTLPAELGLLRRAIARSTLAYAESGGPWQARVRGAFEAALGSLAAAAS